MTKNTFRQEALDHKNSDALGGEVALPHDVPLKLLILLLLLVLSLVPIFLIFGSYTDRTTVVGTILPATGLFKLVSPVDGYVDMINVAEGQVVSEGDSLLSIGSSFYGSQDSADSYEISAQAIRSPVSGKVATLNIYPKQNVRKYKTLLTVVPIDNIFEAALLVPSTDIGFIDVGHEVSIRYDAFPYQKYGQAKGKVASISSTSFSISELADIIGSEIPLKTKGSLYIVNVALDKQFLDLGNVNKKLKTGMTLSADIKLENRKLYQWILDPLLSIEKRN